MAVAARLRCRVHPARGPEAGQARRGPARRPRHPHHLLRRPPAQPVRLRRRRLHRPGEGQLRLLAPVALRALQRDQARAKGPPPDHPRAPAAPQGRPRPRAHHPVLRAAPEQAPAPPPRHHPHPGLRRGALRPDLPVQPGLGRRARRPVDLLAAQAHRPAPALILARRAARDPAARAHRARGGSVGRGHRRRRPVQRGLAAQLPERPRAVGSEAAPAAPRGARPGPARGRRRGRPAQAAGVGQRRPAAQDAAHRRARAQRPRPQGHDRLPAHRAQHLRGRLAAAEHGGDDGDPQAAQLGRAGRRAAHLRGARRPARLRPAERARRRRPARPRARRGQPRQPPPQDPPAPLRVDGPAHPRGLPRPPQDSTGAAPAASSTSCTATSAR